MPGPEGICVCMHNSLWLTSCMYPVRSPGTFLDRCRGRRTKPSNTPTGNSMHITKVAAAVRFGSSVPAQSSEDALDNSTSNYYFPASPSRPVGSNTGSLCPARKHVPHVEILIVVGHLFFDALHSCSSEFKPDVLRVTSEGKEELTGCISSAPVRCTWTSGIDGRPPAPAEPSRSPSQFHPRSGCLGRHAPCPGCSQNDTEKTLSFFFPQKTKTSKRCLHHTTHEIS